MEGEELRELYGRRVREVLDVLKEHTEEAQALEKRSLDKELGLMEVPPAAKNVRLL